MTDSLSPSAAGALSLSAALLSATGLEKSLFVCVLLLFARYEVNPLKLKPFAGY